MATTKIQEVSSQHDGELLYVEGVTALVEGVQGGLCETFQTHVGELLCDPALSGVWSECSPEIIFIL